MLAFSSLSVIMIIALNITHMKGVKEMKGYTRDGQRLYIARRVRRITQAEMAAHMGLSRPTYAKLERNPMQATIMQAEQIKAYIYGEGYRAVPRPVDRRFKRRARVEA